ncbi:MAG: efflux RND transporter permease subunit [Hyphomicrobiaceae bacterium]|nr:efflux RND transporter permease subunit [Hyphomicrobiaceae bacterium]
MNPAETCIKRPVMTTLVMVAIVLFGLVAYRSLPVAELPSVDFPTIEISASLPGAGPETMASAVATPIENQLSRIAGIKAMTSVSSTGSTKITIEFELDRNIDAAALDVQTAISTAQRSLPAEMLESPSFRKINPADFAVYYLRLSSATLPVSTLSDYAETVLQQQVSTIKGVAQVQFWGQQKYAVRVQIDPRKLVTKNVAFDDIERAIRGGNSNLPTGSLSGPNKEFSIKTTGNLGSAQGYNDVVVSYRNGAPVRIRDIGRAIDSVEQDKVSTWFGNEQGMLMAVYRQPGSNTVEIVDGIAGVLPQLRLQIPAAVTLEVIYDRSKTIRASIEEVQFTLVLAAALVVMVIFLFLRSLSATFIASVALPISVIGTFAAMYALGFSLNNLSLMALTLAVGFVVDDAIVMLENIVRHREAGMSAMEAAIKGSREIGFTIISMTISLVAVFIPVIFMGGMLGRLLNEFALTITAAILVSGLVSLTLTPMLCSRMLSGHHGSGGRLYRASEAVFDGMLWVYDTLLRWCLRHRFLVLLSFFGSIWATVHLYGIIQKDFLPAEDTGRLLVRTEAALDASYDAMMGYQAELAKIASADPNIAVVMSRVGASFSSSNTNQGMLFVTLKARHERPEPAIDKIVQNLRRRLNTVVGIRSFVLNPPAIRVGGRLSNADYQYTMQDLDLESLYRWVATMQEEMRRLPGFQDVTSDLKIGSPTVMVDIERDRAATLGVDARQIEQVLAAAFGARKVSTIYTSSSQYAVILEVMPEMQRSAAGLSEIYVRSSTGKLVSLDTVTRQRREVAPLQVNHQGQMPAVTISFNLSPEVSLGTAIDQVRALERRIAMPPTISTSFGGTAAAFEQSMANMGVLLLMAVLVVYLVLGILYESYIHPLTILSGLPAAGLGALIALMVAGLPLTLYAFVGVIMLVGIVKKNAIMIIDFALEAQRNEGKSPEEAIYEACRLRFRPIMMTTFAALAGALPIAIGHGAGAEARAPLGITVVGGLAVSQVITLFLTPVIYLYLDKVQQWISPTERCTGENAGHPAVTPGE